MISSTVRAMCGRWRPRDSSVVIDLSVRGEMLLVTAIDADDGEALRISDLEWDDESISFTMTTPSTQWSVSHRLRLQENGAIGCTTTIVDRWERVS